MSNQAARPPGDSLPLQTVPAPQRRGHLRGRARCWSLQARRAALATWHPRGAPLPPLGGLLPLHPQTPLRYARHCMAAVGGRRAPRRSRAALPACPPQPPVRRLLPLASVPPAGADRAAALALGLAAGAAQLASAAAGPQRHRGTALPRRSSIPLCRYTCCQGGRGRERKCQQVQPCKVPCRLHAPLHLGASCVQPSGTDAPIRKVVQDFSKIPAREIEKAARKGGFSLYLII